MIAIGNGPRMLSVCSGMTMYSKESALRILEGEEWSELYLRLPMDWEDAIKALGEGFEFDSVVEEMTELGQVRIPEDAQIVKSWRPFLESMWAMIDDREVHCLMDPVSFGQHRQISLDLASASIRAKIGFLDVEEWRELLEEDVELFIKEGEREASLLSRRAREDTACVDLSPESERRLEESGFHIRRVSTGTLELPLSALKGEIVEARKRGEAVSDERIEAGIRNHLWFLELLLVSGSFEEACLTWYREVTTGS
jgi:hypothetical protein